MNRFPVIACLLPVLVLGGCSKPKPASAGASPTATPPAIAGLPVSVTLKQRTKTAIPGAEGGLSLSVDDITGGQTMVSLSGGTGGDLIAPVWMKTGDAKPFEFGGQHFELRLTRLDNALIGEDFAALTVSASSPPPAPGELSESGKIQLLIGTLDALQGAKFRRNGKDYPASEAGSHLRRKLDAADGKITTAGQFIEQLATKSSVSGEEYEIRFSDGRTVKTAEFLRAELAKMGKKAAPSSPSHDVDQRE